MTPNVDAETWGRLFDRLDDEAPPALEVAERLADALDLSVADAQAAVYDAIDADLLEEDGEGFGGVSLAAEGGSADDTPTPHGAETAEDGPDNDEIDASRAPTLESWADVDTTDTITDEWPPAHRAVDSWMLRKDGKAPWAPWANPDAAVACNKGHDDHDGDVTCAECSHSARFKWGSDGSREHVHADAEAALEWREKHPEAGDDLVFIQRESDPFAFVDGDDVRDPETGELHPEFLRILDAVGVSYADVSASGAGVHVMFRGELPDGVKQATFPVDDEPFGANDEKPAVEIYDGKHVCVATGDHIAGTGLQVREWNADGVEDVLDEFDQLPEENPSDAFDNFDAEEYTPGATASGETTEDIRDVFAALDPLDARRVAERTIVDEWKESSSVDNRAFIPTWADAGYDGTANFVNRNVWKDSGKRGGYGGPVCMAAIDAGLVRDGDCPGGVRGETWFEAVDHLRGLGFEIPELVSGGSGYDDPREVDATVDPRRAWEAAGRVTPDDVDGDDLLAAGETFACPDCAKNVDVVRAVAIAEGLVETCDESLDEAYPEAYRLARDDYGAPLPQYYTTSDAIAEFDAVLSVIGEVGFFHLDADALRSDVTEEGDDVGGEAVRALNPAWRESESEASVLVFPSGTVWDADTERTIDALRFVALDAGVIDDPSDSLSGGRFTTAYRLARRHYGAPLPRWEPAEDGERAVTPMLPPSEDLVDDPEAVAVSRDRLDEARAEVEELVGEVSREDGTPNVVRTLPATGKTTATVKNAADQPTSYLAPRKELQQQALDKADRWGVDARVLPVFSDASIDGEVLTQAVGYVRQNGKDTLRDRWTIRGGVCCEEGELYIGSDDEEEESVDLDRATCPTADGEHGEAWGLVVHVARKLGYTPREIHTKAKALFGAELPCCEGEERCTYSEGWDHVADPENPADLLVGSYVHAHVESVRTYYEEDDGQTLRSPRSVVLDEYPGEAFSREFGEEALDFATWLASTLREDVEDQRDAIEADLWGDEWVRAWLDGGAAEEVESIAEAVSILEARAEAAEAAEAAAAILDEVSDDRLEDLDVFDPLSTLADGSGELRDVYEAVTDATDVPPDHPAAGLLRWVDDAVTGRLATALTLGEGEDVEIDTLPVDGDLRALVAEAVEAAESGHDGAASILEAAATALQGGEDGCRELAVWADDGYAHPDAHHLLTALAAPSEAARATTLSTSSWAFDPAATDGTRVDSVNTGERATTVVDRNGHGAILHTPPSRASGGEGDAPLVGLDATARPALWRVAVGEGVEIADIHDSEAERAEFLQDALGLRVVQASDRPRPYEGDPSGKDLDGDVALIEALAEDYSGVHAPRQRGDDPTPVGKPAVITTKGVRNVLEDDDRLDGVVSAWENYGNVTGANDLGGHRLAALLGSQHFGDNAVERFAALAGEEVDTSRRGGRGVDLDYGSDLANEYLGHMREDQTMQAILRFARGESGATVVARTSALRDDLPVVGRGQVVETWSETASKVARAWRRLGEEFTRADVADAVDVTTRQVRRVLAEFVDAGYLSHVGGGDGTAKVYSPRETPSAGEVDLPSEAAPPAEPGQAASNEYHTWNVRVGEGGTGVRDASTVPPRPRGAPPAPDAALADGDPPS